jgi:energy-coupling factor transporter ATP-binding protein EcfA2
MALARVERLTFAYPESSAALRELSLEVERGEVVLLLGASGSGKSTLLRALAGLVPWFHGGRFEGRVEVGGRDTRSTRPTELAGTVATVFQDPEDQVILGRVDAEVAFALENVGTPPQRILPRVHAALAAVGIDELSGRRVTEISGGELQRVCLASALALEPELLLLDEPTSQLDPSAAEAFFELALSGDAGVVISEQRPAVALRYADRVVFLEQGRVLLDAPRDDALVWLAERRPAWVEQQAEAHQTVVVGEVACRVDDVSFAYGQPVLQSVSLELRRGEVVALTGANGAGKTTLAKLVAGLLEPNAGRVVRNGTAAMLLQDPGRYLVRERADEEVALGSDLPRARQMLAALGLGGSEARHPRDLSTGERERLALATVLVADPDVLVLDEPTRGVDPERKHELAALLRAGAADRTTLVVTNDRAFAALVADREVTLASEREPILA